VRKIVGSTIKLVCVASPLSMHH